MTVSGFGVHVLVWTGRWDSASARSAVERTAAAGYDQLELGCLDSWDVDADGARRLLDEYGLGVVGSLGLGPATDVTSPDPDVVAAGEALLTRAVGTVRDLGGSLLTGITYAALGKYDAPPTADGWARSVDVMQRVADRAAAAGVTIGVEVVNRYDSNLINTAAQALRYLDDVDRPNVVVHLDTYHMNMEESDLMTPVLRCADRLGYVHISESHRGYLGSGTVDFTGFFTALAAAGYDGTVTFESFSSEVVEPNLSSLLGIWRNVWDDSDHLAGHARRYLGDLVEATSRVDRAGVLI